MNATDVARHELIGLDVVVERIVRETRRGSSHVVVEGGLSGLVVDETKNTFLVETPTGVKRVPKPGKRFLFRVGNTDVAIDGDDIMFQPEDRTKKVRS